MTYHVTNIDQLPALAEQLLAEHQTKIWTFTGDLGAGKTTFIKTICDVLGVKENISSPTFSIINEYHSAAECIFHMDWYRLESMDQLLNIGIEEYLFSGDRCLIEWPQIGESLLDFEVLHLQLIANDDGSRSIIIID